jgi:hypothetical protein
MPKPRPATAQKEKHTSKRPVFLLFLFPVISRVPQLEETATKLQTALGQLTFEQAAVLPPPLAKIRGLEAENARLMRENHDLHRMLSDTTAGPRRPRLPFDVVPRPPTATTRQQIASISAGRSILALGRCTSFVILLPRN